MSQNKQILKHLKSGKTITPLQADRQYGIMRLASRIGELRVSHEIITEMVKQGGKRFARYRLI